MAQAISYKKDIKTTVSAKGTFNLKDMTITTKDDEVKSLITLLSDFDGEEIALAASTKSTEELEFPEVEFSEYEEDYE